MAAIISTAASSLATICVVGATRYFPPILAAGLGACIGGLILFLYAKSTEKALSLRKMSWSQLRALAKIVFLRGFLGGALLIYGFSLTTGIKAVFLTKIEPYFVMLWVWLLRDKRPDLRHLIWLCVHIFGAMMLSGVDPITGVFSAQIGDGLIILAMLVLSYTYLEGLRISRSIGSNYSAAITSFFGGCLLMLLAFVVGQISFANVTSTAWAYFIGYLILYHVIALSFWFHALSVVPGWLVSALRALGPLFGAPVAWFLLGDSLTLSQMLGGFLVITTSFGLARMAAGSQ